MEGGRGFGDSFSFFSWASEEIWDKGTSISKRDWRSKAWEIVESMERDLETPNFQNCWHSLICFFEVGWSGERGTQLFGVFYKL